MRYALSLRRTNSAGTKATKGVIRARRGRGSTMTVGEGRLKKQASALTVDDIPQVVKDLKAASYEGREKCAHLIEILAASAESNPAALVM